MLWFILLFIIRSQSANGLIPKQCASNVTWTASVCCPTPSGFESPCGYPKRGICERTQTYHQILKKNRVFYMESHDIRMFWPTLLYSHVCKCNARYWGPDCGECWFGYTGRNCKQRVLKKRRNVLTYTKEERRQLIAVLVKSRQVPSDYVVPHLIGDNSRWSGRVIEVDNYELVTFIHWFGAMPTITDDRKRCYNLYNNMRNFDSGHADVGFPFYHRYVLLLMERLLSPIAEKYFGVKNFSLPYWEWTNTRQCDICTDDLIGRETQEWNDARKCYFISTKSPLGSNASWPVYCDNPDASRYCHSCFFNHSPSRLCRRWVNYKFPTIDQVIRVLEMTKLNNNSDRCSTFADSLEGLLKCSPWWKEWAQLHITVHVFAKGTMDPPKSSMYDPLFFLHHVQIDRLFERWLRGLQLSQRELPNLNRNEPMCRDCNMPTFYPVITYKDLFADSRELGYTFDNLSFGPLSEKVHISDWISDQRLQQ